LKNITITVSSNLKNAFIEDCNLTNSGAKILIEKQIHFRITDLNIFENRLKAFHTEGINKQIEAIKVNQTGKLSFYSTILKTNSGAKILIEKHSEHSNSF
jgi:hypothetical protein